MPPQAYPTTPDPEIFLAIGGDLRLAGADAPEVFIESGDSVTVDSEPGGARVRVSTLGDCSLRVPRQARLTLESVGGDARPVKDVAAAPAKSPGRSAAASSAASSLCAKPAPGRRARPAAT